jgi:hypothetical protein
MNTSSAVAECVERDAREKFSAWAAVLGAPAVPARYFIARPFRCERGDDCRGGLEVALRPSAKE